MRTAIFVLLFASPCMAADSAVKEWTVEGVKREAIVVAPKEAKSKSSPLVFIFHGHGGTMRHAQRTMTIHNEWPEAVCIYPQGLKTPGQITDPEGNKTGWQRTKADQGDRDLKFFDEMLSWAKKEYQIDAKRIYSTGHSNGGSFTLILWAARGDTFAAFAPSAATAFRLQKDFKPKPYLHVMGEKDPLVSYASQKLAVESVKKLNGVDSKGHAWHDQKYCTEFDSKSGTPVVTLVHPGEHNYPTEAPKAIVTFFKEHALK